MRDACWQTGGVNQKPDNKKTSRPAPPELTEAQLAALKKASATTMVFTILVFATILTVNYPLPWKVAGFGFGIAALVYGIRAIVHIVAAKVRTSMGLVTVIGLILVASSMASLLVSVALWPVQEKYETCVAESVTIQATDACQGGLMSSIEEMQERIIGSATDPQGN